MIVNEPIKNVVAGRTRASSADTRRKVLDAAIEVFAAKGYSGASVNELLAATGLSKPTLYYYFGSKEGLFRAILDFAYDESHRLMTARAGEANSPEESMVAAVQGMFAFAENFSSLTRLVLGTVFAAKGEVPDASIDLERRKRNLAVFSDVIRSGLSAGLLDSKYDPDDLTNALLGATAHAVRTRLSGRGSGGSGGADHAPLPLDAARARRIVGMFLDGARGCRRDSK